MQGKVNKNNLIVTNRHIVRILLLIQQLVAFILEILYNVLISNLIKGLGSFLKVFIFRKSGNLTVVEVF
jgi:hypothetical protein